MVKRQVSKRNFVCHFSVWAHAENAENGPFPAPPGRNKRKTETRDVSIHVVNEHIPRQ